MAFTPGLPASILACAIRSRVCTAVKSSVVGLSRALRCQRRSGAPDDGRGSLAERTRHAASRPDIRSDVHGARHSASQTRVNGADASNLETWRGTFLPLAHARDERCGNLIPRDAKFVLKISSQSQ